MPNTRYHYRIVNASGTAISPSFSFKTFPPAGTDAPFTILFGSCQQRRPTDSGATFEVAKNLGGDFFIHLGDWSYPDYRLTNYPADPATIRESYALRFDTSYAFARSILSNMGIAYGWDDHDYAGNNSDGSIPAPVKSQLLDGYRRYTPHYPLANPSNGIWHSFRIGNVEVFMIDSRSQRNPADSAFEGNTFSPSPTHSMLAGYSISGIDQRRWLLDAIRNSTARWKILASQVYFNPASGPGIPLALLIGRKDVAVEFADKWIGYPSDIDSMKALLSTGAGRNLLVISGDAHTNLYDNGTNSIVPEFMVGNLDIQNSNLFALMKSYGFNVWTEGQPDSLSTIGRIRIETTPRHRLIIESFNEKGELSLSYELSDSATSSAPGAAEGTWHVRGATVLESGRLLRLEMTGRPMEEGALTIFNLEGKLMGELPLVRKGAGDMTVRLPALPNGAYMGRVRSREREEDIRFVVVQ
jgi:hypothetical protein